VAVRGAVCGTVFGLACGGRRWPRPPMAARDPAIRQKPAARPALTCSRTTSRPPSLLPQAGRGRPAGRQQHGSASGEPDAGAHTRRVPKFADQHVLVVPPAGDASSGPEVTAGDCIRTWPRPATRRNVGKRTADAREHGMAAAERPGVRAGRQRRAMRMTYLGCAAALGYGVLKLIWSLGGTLGLRDPEVLRASLTATTRVRRFFDYWGTPILAGLAGNVGDVEVHESLPMRVIVQERAPDHRAAEQGLHRAGPCRPPGARCASVQR
jgi:hypothetical protein